MKRINQLKKKVKKYQDGGVTDPPAQQPTVSDKAAAATETKNFNNITPFSWDAWNASLQQFPQGYNTTQGGKNPPVVNTVYYYVGNTITPAIKQRQEILNQAYAKKYGKTYDPKNPTSFQPTEDQYLTPEESDAALQSAKLGTYNEYLQYANAYNAYRAKTQISNTNTQGTQEDPNQPQNYGIRHYNLFTPNYTAPVDNKNSQQTTQPLPQQAMGGRFGDLIGDIGKMNWSDAGELASNYGKAMADSTLSTVGLSNVIQDDAYKGAGAGIAKTASKITGTINSMILPAALSAAGVPPQVTKAAQQAIGSFNPEQQYPNGGMSMNPNAELEKQEVFQTPQGQVEQVNGPSHEQGGVPVNIPQGTKIWSDRLKMNGKTFAKHAAKYKTDKEEKILDNTKASMRDKQSAQLNMATKTKKLDELFMAQESLKAKKINNYIKKYGGIQKYPEGGVYQFTEPEEENPTLPATLEEIEMQRRNNLINQGLNPSDELNPQLPPMDIYDQNFVPSRINAQQVTPMQGSREAVQTPQTLQGNESSMLSKTLGAFQGIGDFVGNNEDALKNIGREAATFGMNNLANLAYLKQQGKKYDKVNYGKITPEEVSARGALRQVNEGYNTARYNLRNSGQMTQAGQIALGSQRMRAGADVKENIDNINVGIKNQAQQFNKNIEMQGMRDEAQNKGQALTNYYTALGSLGSNSAMQTRDYMQRAMDQKKMTLINQMFPQYQFDPKTFEYMYRRAQQGNK